MSARASAPAPSQPSPARRALYLFAGALALRLVYYAMIRRTACLDINLDPISDMEAFHRWALTIVNGDWLGRVDFHPFHPWQTAVAARDQWTQWYGHVFHQEPFYAYLVALIYLLAPREPTSAIAVQLALGAAGCAFTYLAARRLVPEGAAIGAGILSALYGPYLYYESLLLRDSFLIPLNAFILWIVLEARARGAGPGAPALWGLAGAAMGLACITKANILPFFLALLVWTLLEARARSPRPRGEAVLALAAGFLALLAPVVARNLAVGAPPLMLTTRGPVEFINGNNPWHIGIGWFDGDDRRVSAYAHDILARSDGHLLPTVAAVMKGWSGDLWGLARLQIVKTGYFFAPFEMPNNASYAYFRLNSALLRHGSLSFFWISPFAALGLAASWPRRRLFAPVYLYLGCGVAATVAFYVIARFRAPFMPAILILAALGGWTLADLARRRRLAACALASLLVGAGFLANGAAIYPDEDFVRPQDCLVSIRGYLSRGMEDAALSEAELGRRLFPEFAEFHKAAAILYRRQGRTAEALEAFRAAVSRDPADAESRRELLRLESRP